MKTNCRNLKLYKKFFHILKENHILNDYLVCLNLYNLKKKNNISNLDDWLNFASNNIRENLTYDELSFLLSDMKYFCDWYLSDKYLMRKYNNSDELNWFKITMKIKMHLDKLKLNI